MFKKQLHFWLFVKFNSFLNYGHTLWKECQQYMKNLEVGQIVNTFGIKGFVKIYPYVDDIKRFDDLKHVYVNIRKELKKLEIEEVKYQKNMVLVKFKGIETVEEAERLRNAYVEIDRSDAIPLEEGTYFIADLLGSEVFSDEGQLLRNIRWHF